MKRKVHWRPAWRGGVLCNRWDCTLANARWTANRRSCVTCKVCLRLLSKL